MNAFIKRLGLKSTRAALVAAACLVAVCGRAANTNTAPAATNTLPAVAATNSAAQSITATNSLDAKHKLAIGDRLSFRIEEDEEDSKPLVVTDSGDVEFPYIGRVVAADKTCKELAREVKAALEKDYYYEATVIIAVDFMTKTSRGKVYLVGPVRSAGAQEMPSDEVLTVSKAIVRAGGFSDYADKKNVRINRKGAGGKEKETIIVDVEAIFDKGKTDVPLVSDDLILIPERKLRF